MMISIVFKVKNAVVEIAVKTMVVSFVFQFPLRKTYFGEAK